MKHDKLGCLAAAGTLAALLSGSALALPSGADTAISPAAFGEDAVNKVIHIAAGTQWVNVTQDDVVKFVVDEANGSERTFTYSFDTNRFALNLARVAPAGVLDHRVEAYIAPGAEDGD